MAPSLANARNTGKLSGEHFLIYIHAFKTDRLLTQTLVPFLRMHPEGEEITVDVDKDFCMQPIPSVCTELLTKIGRNNTRC